MTLIAEREIASVNCYIFCTNKWEYKNLYRDAIVFS